MKTNSKITRDIYHIYELEAHSVNVDKNDFFWKNTFRLFGVFIFMTFVVFFMINFRFISSQLADWYNARDYGIAVDFSSGLRSNNLAFEYLNSGVDKDGDGIVDKTEKIIGTDINSEDSDQDGYNDFKELSSGHSPFGEGLLKAEIDFPGEALLPVSWQNQLVSSNKIALKQNDEKIIFNDSFIIPLEYTEKDFSDDYISLIIHLENDEKIIINYKEISREIVSDFSEIKNFRDGIQLISGWPEGTDWQKLIVNLELVKISLIK